MRTSRSVLALAAAALTAAALVAAPTTAQAAETVTVTPLHFKVDIGPTGSEVCDIVGDLYLPASASSTNRVPAILTTNGFGGSKDDQAGIGTEFAGRGYAVLSYSGLGFGGSGCKITLDDPDWDGKAASQLVSYLGGKSGIAFTDAKHTVAAPVLDVVQRDAKDHAGHAVANDPRVGMVGGSYGGQVQYAAAAVDKRVDTIVPVITWSDLSYSLSPNNTSQTVGVQTSTPGAAKLVWALGFSGIGIADGVANAAGDPGRLIGCPNFAFFVCPALVVAGVTGTVDATTTASLRHASVSSYVSKVTVPTLVIQGQNDTLFNLNEGIANYRALQAQGTPTKMIWFSGGHSGPNAPGEFSFSSPNSATEHVTRRVSDWLDHYLKGSSVGTGPEFAYFRDWVPYTGIATPAYGSASSYPVGTATKYYLSGSALTTNPLGLKAATQNFLTPVAGVPTSTDPLDVIGSALPLPEIDLPGTTATWTTAALTANVDVVGSPSLRLQVKSPTAALTQALGSTGQLVVFVKVLDVDPAGKATLIHNLIAPVRVPDVTKPFTVTLPAISHRFATGHQLRLMVAGGSTNYRGGLTPNAVSITTGSASQALTLPVVK
ncbi:CocE/NonD family hydrolase [Aeromicrobium ginsengisoli]|uniref:Prolyl oligopeptidase family serine peptidase n=1 Tax=Aeromicrobium ginsengisoli TaxID=363867 RepID=A0A5M4FAU2_9ACTN|nr:CocE/NonD family hydrolase [Aeromicrobium ginsengisoli]KAA1395506.1 prolyl oligopeptidase family serine peptidase [Aeromicrobium ginsengisoli]